MKKFPHPRRIVTTASARCCKDPGRRFAAACSAESVSDAILDGKIIDCGRDGAPALVIEMPRDPAPMCFVAFGLHWLDDEDLRPAQAAARKMRLSCIAPLAFYVGGCLGFKCDILELKT